MIKDILVPGRKLDNKMTTMRNLGYRGLRKTHIKSQTILMRVSSNFRTT
jgi:hypothetical protein